MENTATAGLPAPRTFEPEKTLYVFLSFAFVGGFLEAYTFLLHGGVFCNAQTGNLVLFFIDAANGEWQEASHYLYSLLAYIAGILVSAALPLLLKKHLIQQAAALIHRALTLCDPLLTYPHHYI